MNGIDQGADPVDPPLAFAASAIFARAGVDSCETSGIDQSRRYERHAASIGATLARRERPAAARDWAGSADGPTPGLEERRVAGDHVTAGAGLEVEDELLEALGGEHRLLGTLL